MPIGLGDGDEETPIDQDPTTVESHALPCCRVDHQHADESGGLEIAGERVFGRGFDRDPEQPGINGPHESRRPGE
jgi:hypothetical protein